MWKYKDDSHVCTENVVEIKYLWVVGMCVI